MRVQDCDLIWKLSHEKKKGISFNPTSQIAPSSHPLIDPAPNRTLSQPPN